MRTGGDAGGSSMGGGRLTPRPDTLRPGTRAGSGPAPQSQIFVGRLIIISSGAPNTGIFVYSGTPAAGNPPVLSIVAPGVTHDPYGNPVASVLNIGNQAAAHFGVNSSGDLFLANASDKVIFHGRSSDGAFFWYNTSGEGAGNLAISIAPASGTDPAGNTFQSGFQFHGANGANIELTAISGVPFEFFSSGLAEETTAANIQADIQNPGASEIIRLIVKGPQITGHPAYVYSTYSGPAKDGSITPGGSHFYNDGVSVNQQLYSWGPNGAQAYSLKSGDTNTYQVAKAVLVNSANITVNQTTFTQQCFGTSALGVGTYVVRGQVTLLANQLAGAAQFEFVGGAAVATMKIQFIETQDATPASFGNAGSVNAFATSITGEVFSSLVLNRVFRFEGTVICTTAGTWALVVATTVAADTYVIDQLGSYMTLEPVGN